MCQGTTQSTSGSWHAGICSPTCQTKPKLGEVYLPIPSLHQSHPHTCPLLSPPSLCRCLLLPFTRGKTLALGADCRQRPSGPVRNTLTASLRHRNGAAMSTDSYERIAAEIRRRGTCFDALIGEEAEGSDAEDEEEEEEEERAAAAGGELPCPFCGEEFDAVGLYCHIDGEHHAEAMAGMCPVCSDSVGINLVAHISSEHPSFLKDKWRNRQSSYASHSSKLALLKKDLSERNRQPLYGGSSRANLMSTVPDPLLSSFVGHFIEVDLPKDAPQELLDETHVGSDSLEQKAVESAEEPLLPEVKEERTRRSHFVQGLVLSLIFDDIL